MECPDCQQTNPVGALFCAACGRSLLPQQRSSSPPTYNRLSEHSFVGREWELEVLYAGLEDSLAGRGRVLLLAGEPGIGKTRLANEFAAHARRRGAQVLSSRCYEGEGAPSFWPWIQLVRAYVSHCEQQLLREEMGPGASDIAQVIPEVRERLPEVSLTPGIELTEARFRFFDSLVRFLKSASTRRPQVLILDDLHWADPPSLLLLQFVTREIREAHVLILATYRDMELDCYYPLVQTLGEIVREPCVQSLHLERLSEADVVRFLESAELRLSPTLTAAVYKATEGNPFFMIEVVGLLVKKIQQASPPDLQSLASFPLPQGVRVAIEGRLGTLSAECRRLLSLAAVIGREFSLDEIEAVEGTLSLPVHGDQLLEVLEEARAARIITEEPEESGRYSFSHALIRETLYEALSVTRRVRLHRQIARALERLYETQSQTHPAASSGRGLAELAYHFLQAARDGAEVEKALTYATRAAEQAMAMLAYEDAASSYERALQALALMPSATELRRGALLLALGESHRKAGVMEHAREAFLRVIELARALRAQRKEAQAASLVASAALGFAGEWWGEYGAVDQQVVGLLQEALETLGAEDSRLRARVLARLAIALYYAPESACRLELSRQAVEVARRVGDRATLAEALNSQHWALWGHANNVEERLAIATEIVRLAEHEGISELVLTGRAWRIADFLELGEVVAVDAEIEAFTRLATDVRQPFYLWWAAVFRVMQALLDGRFAEVETLAKQAAVIGRRAPHQGAIQAAFGAQLLVLRLAQGQLQELEERFTRAVAQFPGVPTWRSALALLYCEMGRADDARREFAHLATHDLSSLPRDANWVSDLTLHTRLCTSLGDTRHAATLYTLLQPYAGRTVVGGRSVCICAGLVSHFLGMLATTLSRWEEAEQHFSEALTLSAKMAAKPFRAEAQHQYALMLLARVQPGDYEKALDLLAQALATAQELGMKSLEEKIRGLKTRGGRQSLAPSTQPLTPNLFRREDAYWTIAYQGETRRVKDARGLHYLAALLREPGREFHVVDLAALTNPRPATAASVQHWSEKQLAAEHLSIADLTDASPGLDQQARTAYKLRMEDLRDELAEAERSHDLGRMAKAQEEIDFLIAELRTAYGLNQHARKSATVNEKIRQAVTKALRRGLQQIQRAHPLLGRHLRTALKTGLFCSYNPEQLISWDV